MLEFLFLLAVFALIVVIANVASDNRQYVSSTASVSNGMRKQSIWRSKC